MRNTAVYSVLFKTVVKGTGCCFIHSKKRLLWIGIMIVSCMLIVGCSNQVFVQVSCTHCGFPMYSSWSWTLWERETVKIEHMVCTCNVCMHTWRGVWVVLRKCDQFCDIIIDVKYNKWNTSSFCAVSRGLIVIQQGVLSSEVEEQNSRGMLCNLLSSYITMIYITLLKNWFPCT